jgi:hypothetical protein
MEHMDELPVMVVQVSANFLIEDINQAVTDTLGYALEEATGGTVGAGCALPSADEVLSGG